MVSEHDTDPIHPDDPLGLIGWTVAGKYKINSYLGGGGFGEVYDGHNVNLPEQRLVIKFFKRVITRDKFIKEARILCMLDHPNISHVIDFLQEEGALVVAFIDGRDCGQILREEGVLPERLFLSVSKSIASAVAYAHERKIAHRDIKPDNIMIDKNNHAYLIDFGIAKQIGGDATRTGYQALTPMFAAPERQQGDADYNPYLSDVYELGVTLFNMVTRTMPYRNPVNPDIGEWGGSAATRINPQLRQIIRKATDPVPAKRYKDVRSMANDLDKITSVYTKGSARKAVLWSVVAVAVAAAGFFGFKAFRGDFASAPATSAAPTETQTTSTPEPIDTQQTPAEASAAIDTSAQSRETSAESAKQGSATTQSQAAEEQPTTSEPEPEPEPLPPPPKPKLRVGVVPEESTVLYVDGKSRPVGSRFETSDGSHSIEIVNPDFPVHTKTIRVAGQFTEDNIDLSRINADCDSVDVRLSWNPPAENVMVNLSMNGGLHRFSRLPVLDLIKPAGIWQIDIVMLPLDDEISEIIVDSCKTWPFGNGPTQKISGNSGRLELTAPSGVDEKVTMIPLQIFWSTRE